MTSTYQTENFIQTYLLYIYLVYFFFLNFSFIQNMISAFDTFIYDFSVYLTILMLILNH